MGIVRDVFWVDSILAGECNDMHTYVGRIIGNPDGTFLVTFGNIVSARLIKEDPQTKTVRSFSSVDAARHNVEQVARSFGYTIVPAPTLVERLLKSVKEFF